MSSPSSNVLIVNSPKSWSGDILANSGVITVKPSVRLVLNGTLFPLINISSSVLILNMHVKSLGIPLSKTILHPENIWTGSVVLNNSRSLALLLLITFTSVPFTIWSPDEVIAGSNGSLGWPAKPLNSSPVTACEASPNVKKSSGIAL